MREEIVREFVHERAAFFSWAPGLQISDMVVSVAEEHAGRPGELSIAEKM